MLAFGNKEFRNLQEQVLKNMSDIQDMMQGVNVLAEFGIKVIGQVDDADELPDPAEYEGEYGDAYIVGTEEPYEYYIFTRAFEGEDEPQWFDLGVFPQPGPQGPQGVKGDTGDAAGFGSVTATTTTLSPGQDATVAVATSGPNTAKNIAFTFEIPQGATGAQGAQGPKGDKGDKGDTGATGAQGEPGTSYVILGQLDGIVNLPDPETVVPANGAYMVGTETPYDLYVVMGTTGSKEWLNCGAVSVGPAGQDGLTTSVALGAAPSEISSLTFTQSNGTVTLPVKLYAYLTTSNSSVSSSLLTLLLSNGLKIDLIDNQNKIWHFFNRGAYTGTRTVLSQDVAVTWDDALIYRQDPEITSSTITVKEVGIKADTGYVSNKKAISYSPITIYSISSGLVSATSGTFTITNDERNNILAAAHYGWPIKFDGTLYYPNNTDAAAVPEFTCCDYDPKAYTYDYNKALMKWVRFSGTNGSFGQFETAVGSIQAITLPSTSGQTYSSSSEIIAKISEAAKRDLPISAEDGIYFINDKAVDQYGNITHASYICPVATNANDVVEQSYGDEDTILLRYIKIAEDTENSGYDYVYFGTLVAGSGSGGGSIDIDGKTIISNSDDELETAIGGWKEEIAATEVEAFDGDNNGSYNSRPKFSWDPDIPALAAAISTAVEWSYAIYDDQGTLMYDWNQTNSHIEYTDGNNYITFKIGTDPTDTSGNTRSALNNNENGCYCSCYISGINKSSTLATNGCHLTVSYLPAASAVYHKLDGRFIPIDGTSVTLDSSNQLHVDLSEYAQSSDLATVATTGDYDDLINKPDIPAADGLTIINDNNTLMTAIGGGIQQETEIVVGDPILFSSGFYNGHLGNSFADRIHLDEVAVGDTVSMEIFIDNGSGSFEPYQYNPVPLECTDIDDGTYYFTVAGPASEDSVWTHEESYDISLTTTDYADVEANFDSDYIFLQKTVETSEIYPISGDFIPIDGTTITLNNQGQLQAASSGGDTSNAKTVEGVFLAELEGPDLPTNSQTPIYLGCIDYNPIPTELYKVLYYKVNPANPLNTDYTYGSTFITNGFQASSDSVTVTLPDGTTVTPNFKAQMVFLQGLNTYVNIYAYFTNPHTSPTYANTVYNDGGKVYLYVRMAQNGSVPTYGYVRFYLRNPITNPTAEEVMNSIATNKAGGQLINGKPPFATANSSITIPVGGVVQLDMNNLMPYNQVSAIAMLNVASGSLNSGTLKDSRVIINYRDSSDNYYLLEFNTRRDDTAQKWYVWGYNPYSSAITININDLTTTNFSMYFCYNRW